MDNRDRDRRVTQVFSESDIQMTGRRFPAGAGGTEMLRGIPRQSEGEADSLLSDGRTRPSGRDPWQQDAEPAGHSHDPHEVTVQLDAVQLGDGFLRQVDEGPGTGHDASSDRPVFVDESGRRSRRYRRIGMAVGLTCAVYAVVIVATLLSGNSNAPWLPVPGQQDGRPAGQVDTPPLPAQSAPPSGTGAATPGSTPTTDEATAPSPGLSAPEAGATKSPDRPGTTPGPAPTAARTTPKPGTVVTGPTPTEPVDQPTTPPADPTPTDEATPTPTETTGPDDGDGTGTVAGAPNTPQPVTEQPDTAPSPAPSPEYDL